MPSEAYDPILSATLAERQRIANDLHDGVASRLMMLLASLPPHGHANRQIAHGLQECLLELQMTVDGLSAECMSLGEMLGNLRYRFEPAFRRSGIAFQWQVSDVPSAAGDDDCRANHELCKIVQEALANALRHSGARHVHVRLARDDTGGMLALEVRDDGRGLPGPGGHEPGAARPKAGGLRNMRARAEAIGAGISIANLSPHGLRVSVTLPLEREPADAEAALASHR
ncbi:signal transduction histidine kinase [Variovorax boronicumulans]|uniref:histidine kinase n=1 Tax=Variovorax boronicumulans TaxID=436515 RepID=A0AAW8CTM8_9BURK|nr:ATP-binding protein [Variovorax boronicumulans]MDP9891211.1 signal transduction histidine kinase [Variovorax boronicumulans]MDP9991934.1 signal transduction histidine kinase [Variovorax boronicumulans]MDQ0001829.1 signal transduction histidine kinase [Variovorax boronicumulans]MDQ0051279.1 signal transduction histidine kinase [Variovorax boronicumulans]